MTTEVLNQQVQGRQRVSLTRLDIAEPGGNQLGTKHGNQIVLHPNDVTSRQQYAKFKHGDGTAATRFGALLAQKIIPQTGPGERLIVTSSAYRAVAPAAHALISPFVATASMLGVDVEVIRVHRPNVSDGDYALMSIAERKRAMLEQALVLPNGAEIADATVIALDDVRVTGVHEEAMDLCLAAAHKVIHGYVVDAYALRHDPQIEAALNNAVDLSGAGLLELAHSVNFVPNARYCKRVLLLAEDELETLLHAAPLNLVQWLCAAIAADQLPAVPAYMEACVRWERVLGVVFAAKGLAGLTGR